MPALYKKSRDELEEIALKRIRARPGCRGTAAVVLTLDDDGERSFEISDPGSADADTVRHAAIAVGHALHDEFDLATG
jgi:sugar/nucleoside kinase (ribokinase family)